MPLRATTGTDVEVRLPGLLPQGGDGGWRESPPFRSAPAQEEGWDGPAEKLSLPCQPGMARVPGEPTEPQVCWFIEDAHANPPAPETRPDPPGSARHQGSCLPREMTAVAPRNRDWQFQSTGDAGFKRHQGKKASTSNRAHTRQRSRSQQLLETAPVKPAGLETHAPASVSRGVTEEGPACGGGILNRRNRRGPSFPPRLPRKAAAPWHAGDGRAFGRAWRGITKKIPGPS